MTAGCHRSHPHEDMDAMCERLTVEARAMHKLANSHAELVEALRNFVVLDDADHPDHEALLEALYDDCVLDERRPVAITAKALLLERARALLAKVGG